MLSVDQALELVLAAARPPKPISVDLAHALDLVLAEEVTSDVDSPPHDKAAVDGYAVRLADLSSGAADLEIVEEITAGNVPRHALGPGQTSRVMTGAPVPDGADAMVMLERTSHAAVPAKMPATIPAAAAPTTAPAGSPDRVRFDGDVTSGQNIIRRGASLRRGQTVLAPGRVLRAIEIGILAEVGRASVRAIPRPGVGVLPTGNELVAVDAVPGPGQIRNSNGPMLLAAARAAGADAVDLGVGRDERAALRALIKRGLRQAVLVISGGVSAGVLDLVPGVLAELGVEEVFHKVNLKPGKPLWFGVHRTGEARRLSDAGTLVFGLPGNPVSSFVCFELFVRPAIAALAGRSSSVHKTLQLPLAKTHRQQGDRLTYHPARLVGEGSDLAVEPLPWGGSSDLHALADAVAMVRLPAGDRTYRQGDPVDVLVLETSLGESARPPYAY